MQLDNHQRPHHTFVESYIDQEHILLQKNLQKQNCHAFMSFISIRNIKNFNETFIKSFITYNNQEQIVL